MSTSAGLKRLLFVVDPLVSFKTYKDSTYSMMVEAAKRGHEVWTCELEKLFTTPGPKGSKAQGHCQQISLINLDKALDPAWHGDWFSVVASAALPLTSFNAVIMRKDPPFDLEFLYSTFILEQAEREGARVFNKAATLRDHNEKLAIIEFPEFTAPTLVTRDAKQIREFIAQHGEAVLKLLDGMGGASIFRARGDDANLSVILETMNQFGARSVMCQKFLPQIAAGDKRILLIGGKPVPYALARVPKAGESRGNLAAGGTGHAQPLSKRDIEIAETLAPILHKRGLLLVGLDVIGDCLTEINVTSPTCFREITAQTGFDVPAMFIDAVEAAI
jgi:glutathione synthase